MTNVVLQMDVYSEALEAYIKSISPPVALPVPVKRKAAAKRKAITPKRKAKRQKGLFMRPRGRAPKSADGAAKVWNAMAGTLGDGMTRRRKAGVINPGLLRPLGGLHGVGEITQVSFGKGGQVHGSPADF